MEALTAVALAGNVLQFAEFAIKLLTSSGELYNKGDLNSNTRIQESIQRICAISEERISQCDDFKRKFRRANGPDALPAALLQHDAVIVKLSHECLDTAQHLQNVLAKLKLPKNAPSRGWTSLFVAIRSITSESEIRAYLARLTEIKIEIDSIVMSSLSTKVDFLLIQQSAQFKALSEENQKITAALLHVEESLVTDFRNQVAALSLLLSRSGAGVSPRMAVDAAASGDDSPVLDSTSGNTTLSEMQLRREVTGDLLNMLAFESIRDRFEGIDEAHQNTFSWIFQPPPRQNSTAEETESQQSGSFPKWLAEQSGVYWINGKAASGKSTLMKYILAHPETTQHLRRWAASADSAGALRPRFASFFFWASGTKEQRSQSGLLRSILYELLIQEPNLVPVAFPEQWSSLYSKTLGFTFDSSGSNMPFRLALGNQKFSWSLSELKRAMRRVILQNEIPLKLCLFVDGLDEYEGDETEIAELFAQFSITDRIKCCVSSRPHKPFLDTFCSVPSLRLQDLTYPDIQQYVSDKLEADIKMQRLAMTHRNDVQDLIDEIVTSASGVFLWVRLVVASLLRGLGNDDSIEDLRARLRALPKDLESLYTHMILRVDEIYQQEASRMFLLVGTATSPRWDDMTGVAPLSTLALKFAVEDQSSLALTAPMHFVDHGMIMEWSRSMTSKLVTRCGGLLEAHVNPRTSLARADITFMHRTVKDFFERPESKSLLEGRATKNPATRFIPDFAILKSMLLLLKAEDKVMDSRHADTVLNVAILHARRLESLSDAPRGEINAVLDELMKTAYHWIKLSPSSRPVFHPESTKYTIAVECGLHHYIRYLLQQDNIILKEGKSKTRSLLSRALSPRVGYGRFCSPRTVESLVEFGANPEEALHFILSYLKARDYETAPADDPDGAGKAELLAASRSLLLKLVSLHRKQVGRELSFLRDHPGEWEDILRLAEDAVPQSRKGPKKRTEFLRMLRIRR